MSTRSFIGKEMENGIEAIYCHWDGYPEHHMPILSGHYNTESAVEGLLDLGDLSVLGPEIGEGHDFDTRTENVEVQTQKWCLAYGRDRGEKDVAKQSYPSERAFFVGGRNAGVEYLYLFRRGKWFWREIWSEKWKENIPA